MTISMYQASAPVVARQLGALKAVLAKGEAFAAEQGIDPAELLAARLAPDMFALTRQVQVATDLAKGGIARLAGQEPPSYADEEASFADLQARLDRTIAFIGSFGESAIDGSEDRDIRLKLGQGEMQFTGQDYLLGFVLPNVYFHTAAAYAILRHKGVPLGKRDFLGGL